MKAESPNQQIGKIMIEKRGWFLVSYDLDVASEENRPEQEIHRDAH